MDAAAWKRMLLACASFMCATRQCPGTYRKITPAWGILFMYVKSDSKELFAALTLLHEIAGEVAEILKYSAVM